MLIYIIKESDAWPELRAGSIHDVSPAKAKVLVKKGIGSTDPPTAPKKRATRKKAK